MTGAGKPGIAKLFTHRFPPGLGTHYCTVCAHDGDRTFLASPAQPLGGSAEPSGLLVLDDEGRVVTRTREAGALSPFLAMLEIENELCVAYWVGPQQDPQLMVLRTRDWKALWSMRGFPWVGNGDFLQADLDGDGRDEIVFSVGGLNNYVACVRSRTGEELWRYDDRVTVCWGRCAIGDIDADGELEVVFGTEYGNVDGTSSIAALGPDGHLRWRVDGIRGDAGSTPTMLADVDGDGQLEVFKVEIDLCGRDGHISNLLCFGSVGDPLYALEFGGSGIAIGDVDEDGTLEGVGLTSGRDGGSHRRSQMVCFDLETGGRKWETDIPRVYLSGDPVISNLTGESGLETLVTTGMPSGYGRVPGVEPWGDAYIFSPEGEVLWHDSFPDWAGDPMACDIDRDGLTEFVIPSYEGRLCAWRTEGPAISTEFRVASGGPHRLGQAER